MAGREDAPGFMIGDVNLFLYDDDDEDDEDANAAEKVKNGEETPEKHVLGELEIMVASQAHRGQGLAQETLRAFMAYIQSVLPGMLTEYSQNSEEVGKAAVLKYLRVKIDKDNVRSLALFERLGFVRIAAEPNYFGEVELRTSVVGGKLGDVERKVGLEGVGVRVRYDTGE
jgi:RimJ/RimL family protein N-acetyltransferase